MLSLLFIYLASSASWGLTLGQQEQVRGIDFGYGRKHIDWLALYNAGYRFVFIKATDGFPEEPDQVKHPEKYGFVNPDLKKIMDSLAHYNRANPDKAMRVGLFHFAEPVLNRKTADKEAEWFFKVAKAYLVEGYLSPALDIEDPNKLPEGKHISDVFSKGELSTWIKTWLSNLEQELNGIGVEIKPILYTDENYVNHMSNSLVNNWSLWIAKPAPLGEPPTAAECGPWGEKRKNWDFWQYTQNKKIGDSVLDEHHKTTTVDLDVFKGSPTELQNFIIHRAGVSPTDKALKWLRTSQKPDGSWSESTGITALVLLSFLNAGISPDDPTDTNKDGVPDLQEAMAYLTKHFDAKTGYFYGKTDVRGNDPCYSYDTSLCSLALIAADRGRGTNNYENVISRAKDYLLSVQYVDDPSDPDYGGWGYPRSGWADLSNTQWVVMALDAAYNYLGLPKPSPETDGTWTNRLLTFLKHTQMSDGGFDYKAGAFNNESLGSMSAAGLWSLLLAGLSPSNPRIAHVENWIRDNYTLDVNPGRGSAALYYYYVSLAKALTMAGLKTITDSAGTKHDWYAELEKKLATLQNSKGFWVNSDTDEWEGNADLCTAYALLALETQHLPTGKQLSWVLTLHSPGTLNVYSPEGDHVGPNSAGGVDEDIPGSSYVVEPTGEQVITISGLEAGTYRVDLIGTSGGVYTLDSVVKQSGQVVSSKTFTGTLVKGQARVTNAVFTAMEGAVTQFMGDLQSTPAGLTATPGNETVNLTWTPFSETGFVLAGYNVYRRTTYGSEYTKITAVPVNVPSYRDAGLTNGITYYYVVTAVSSTGSETPYSPEVEATPSLTEPGQTAKIVCGPNPVGAGGVTFFYALPQGTTEAQIMIFDISGRMVFQDWLDPTGERYPAAGSWNPTNTDGAPLENGPYVFVLIADGKSVAQGKMVIQR